MQPGAGGWSVRLPFLLALDKDVSRRRRACFLPGNWCQAQDDGLTVAALAEFPADILA